MISIVRKQANRILGIFPPRKLVRFLVVGSSAAVVSLGVLYGLRDGLGLHYMVAGVGSWLTAMGIAYTGNSKWTFGFFPRPRGFGRFIVSNLGTAAIGFSLYALFTGVAGIWYMASSVLSTGCVTLINWLSSRYWIWRQH